MFISRGGGGEPLPYKKVNIQGRGEGRGRTSFMEGREIREKRENRSKVSLYIKKKNRTGGANGGGPNLSR